MRKRIFKGKTQKDTAMNIKFITRNRVGGSDGHVTEVDCKVLPLCGQGRPEGSAEGLMPLKLANGVVVTPKVTVYSNTSTNRKGAVNAVIKVSIPYTHPLLSENGQSIVGVDAAKSGGALSMHTVVELPAQAVKALSGALGKPMAAAGLGQVAVVARLLGALTGERLWKGGYSTGNPATDGQSIDWESAGSAPRMRERVGENPTDSTPQDKTLVPTDKISGFTGDVGFDISGYNGDRTLNETISRIIQKLPALGCSDIVDAPVLNR